MMMKNTQNPVFVEYIIPNTKSYTQYPTPPRTFMSSICGYITTNVASRRETQNNKVSSSLIKSTKNNEDPFIFWN